MKWQPIDTAPKDGTDVLVYLKHRPPAVAGYFQNHEKWLCYDSPRNPLHPTHWIPIPEPPND